MIYNFPPDQADLAHAYAHYAWANHTSFEIEEKRVLGELDQAVVILPIAAIEQHGPHLPLAVDAVINQAVLAKALSLLPLNQSLFHVPMISVGMSLEHCHFMGTLTLSDQQMIENCVQTATCLKASGIRKIVMFNSHGGNSPIMDLVAIRLRMKEEMAVVKTSWTRLVDLKQYFSEDEVKFGIHGGAAETSLMMHIAPEMVRMDQLGNFASSGERMQKNKCQIAPTGPASFAWASEDLNSQGVVGNALQATAETGRQILDAAGRALALMLQEFYAHQVTEKTPWPIS